MDITSPSLDKFGLYLAARIPEVWRSEGTSHSLSFPHLTASMLERYLGVGREQGSAAMLQTVKSEIPQTPGQ